MLVDVRMSNLTLEAIIKENERIIKDFRNIAKPYKYMGAEVIIDDDLQDGYIFLKHYNNEVIIRKLF